MAAATLREAYCPFSFIKVVISAVNRDRLVRNFDDTIHDSIQMYLKEIGQYPLVSAAIEKELAKRIQAGDNEAKNLLAKANEYRKNDRNTDNNSEFLCNSFERTVFVFEVKSE